jgi:sterol 3beta-glucosyltransferase
LELKKAGHRVRIVAFQNYETFIDSYGLEFYPIKGDIARVASSEETRVAMQADNPLKLFLSFNKLKSLVVDIQKDFFEACKGSDVIVYHPGAPIGYFAAAYLKIPCILATPFPMTPTKEYPALIFYDFARLGRLGNLATHKLFEQIMWFASSSAVRRFWKLEFGYAPPEFSCPFAKQNSRVNPTIISCSNYVFPRPKDWSENIHSSGYWFGIHPVNCWILSTAGLHRCMLDLVVSEILPWQAKQQSWSFKLSDIPDSEGFWLRGGVG